MKSFDERVLDTLAHFPEGLSHDELKSLFPEVRTNGVHAALYNLRVGECAHVIKMRDRDVGRPEKIWAATGRAYEDRNRGRDKMKARKPTSIAIDARLSDALAKIAELEAWQAHAIARYPDLAVEPAIIEARKRVAAILRETGDTSGADQVMHGNRDHTPIVKAVAATIRDLA